MHKKGFHYFLLKLYLSFLSHSAEKFRGEPFNVSENFGYRKILCIRKGYHYSPLKIFCLTVPKNFVGKPFNVSENFGYRKILCVRRGFHYFLLKPLLPHSAEKFRRGNPSVLQKNSDIKNIHA